MAPRSKYVTIPGISRLNIPALKYNDGPQGFEMTDVGSTTAAFLTVAASWDTNTMRAWRKYG